VTQESTARVQPWLLVGASTVVIAWGGNQFLPLMQMYRALFDYSQFEVDVLLAFYIVGIIPGFALAGPLSDRHGRKPVMVAGLALGIVGSALLAVTSSSLIGMCLGRTVSGLSVAAGMVVGSSWIKEHSQLEGRGEAGARRAAIALSLGFAGGAGVAGALAQWGPMPTVLPYLVHGSASLLAWIAHVRAPETSPCTQSSRALLANLRVPRDGRAVFWRTIVPLAPWVFAAPTLSFAVGPSLVGSRLSGMDVAFAAAAAVVTLLVGTATQLFSRRLVLALRGHAMSAGVLVCCAGAVLLSLAADDGDLWPVAVAAPVFGLGYGLTMVAGLTAVQALATPQTLAGVTAVFYALTYVGFLLPAALAAAAAAVDMRMLLLAVAAAGVLTAAVSSASLRRLGRGQ
jgi:MFS family permease